MGTILDFERIGILLNSFSVISGFCADMLDRNCFGQCIHFGGLYPFCELVHSTAAGWLIPTIGWTASALRRKESP